MDNGGMIREFYDDTGDCQEMSLYKSDGSCKQYSIKKIYEE